MHAPFQAKNAGRFITRFARALCRRANVAPAMLLLCILTGCAGSRNKMAGDPLLGDFSPERIKARSSPQANGNTAANNKVPPIPRIDMNASNAELARQDPLTGLAIDRRVPESQQDPWKGQQRTNGVPTVMPLPRDEQMPSPQIVPPSPKTGTTGAGWQRTTNQDPYNDYMNLMQKTTANEMERLKSGMQQVQNDLSAGAAQMQQNAINPLVDRADAIRTAAGAEVSKLGASTQELRDNVSATASHLQQDATNRMEAIRSATTAEFNRLMSGAHQFKDSISNNVSQLQQNTLNAFGQRTDAIKNTATNDIAAAKNQVQHLQDNVTAKTVQVVDYLQAELQARGMRWQKQEAVPEGVRFSCIVPLRNNPNSSRIYEATAADYSAAVRAVLQQIDNENR